MESTQLNWIVGFIWGIADDMLRDVYVRGKYRDVILPMTVIRTEAAHFATMAVMLYQEPSPTVVS